MNNKIKGDNYEEYTKLYLLQNNELVFKWNDIPMKYFIEANFYKFYSDKLKFKRSIKDEKHNIQDTGCDILYFNKNDNKWIIVQCKNYSNTVYINDLAGFVLLVCNIKLNGELYYTSKLSSNITLYNSDTIKYIKLLFNNNIETTTESYIKLKPYQYQLDAYEKLKNKKRSILQLPCGMGKTLVSIIWAKQFDIIIIFSPLKQHAQQNLKRFKNELDNYRGILVDSDGTRDLNDIKQYLDEKLILSVCYKSVDIIKKLIKHIINHKVGVIIDEFHNLSFDNITNTDDYFYKVLNQEKFNYLFMSATPRIFDLEGEFTDCNNNITGNIEYKFDFGKAIKDGYICDYDIYVPKTKLKSKAMENVYKYLNITDNENIDTDIKAHFLLRGMEENGHSKCITYSSCVKDANKLKKSLKRLALYHETDLYLNMIIYDTSKKERNEILEEFQSVNKKAIIISVHILDECIDIPKCDSIFISSNQNNKIKSIQRICRANRKDIENKNKRSGIYAWTDEYDDIINIISCLKEFDSSFTLEKVKLCNYYNEDEKCVIERKKEKEEDKDYIKLNEIIVKVKKVMTWNEKKELLFEYCDDNKKVPLRRFRYKHIFISAWLYNQIQQIANKECNLYIKLSKNKYVKKSIDEYLENKNKKLSFDEKINLLFEYCDKEKKTPVSETIYKNILIGKFLQRNKNKVTDKKCDLYILLSTNKYIKTSLNASLENKEKKKNNIKLSLDENVKLLFEYCKKEKEIPLRQTIYKNIKIGLFLKNKKTQTTNNKCDMYVLLSKNKYVKKSLDTMLETKQKNKENIKLSFDEKIELLFEYCDKYDKTPSYRTKYKNIALGEWLSFIKKNITKKSEKYIKLSENECVKLSIDKYIKDKDTVKLSFDQKKKLLFEYCDKYDKTPSSRIKYKNIALGQWLSSIKKNITKKSEKYIKLSKNKCVKLSIDKYLKDKREKKNKVLK